MRVADGAFAAGDGGGGGRRRRAGRRHGGAPARLPGRVRAAQGPARTSRQASAAPRHRRLQVLLDFLFLVLSISVCLILFVLKVQNFRLQIASLLYHHKNSPYLAICSLDYVPN